MSFLRSCLLILLCAAGAMAAAIQPGNSLVNGLGGPAGFGENQLAPNDDSSVAVDLTSVFPAGLNFYGTTYTTIYLNNNGNLTFVSPTSDWTPDPIVANVPRPMIAAWWTDLVSYGTPMAPSPGGTSTGSDRVWYDFDTVNGVITFTWDDVSQIGHDGEAGNAFQIRLHNMGGTACMIEVRYESLAWHGNTNARAGFSADNGQDYREFPESGTNAMLNLATTSNLGHPGVFIMNTWSVHSATANTNADPILFTVTAPYPVGGLGVEDFDVANGRAYNMTGGPSAYQLWVHPDGDGLVTVTLHADAVYREYDPPNLQPPNPQVIYTTRSDRTAPTLIMPAPVVTGANVQLLTTVTDGGSGIATYAWTVESGGAGLSFNDAATEDPIAITTGVGAWTVRLTVTDHAGNTATGTTTVSRVTPAPPPAPGSVPHLLISGPSGTLPPAAFPVRIIADTAVTGLDAGAVSVINGTIASAAASSGVLDLSIAPTGQGRVTVTVAGGTVLDLAGTPAATVEKRFVVIGDTSGFTIDGITLSGVAPTGTAAIAGTIGATTTTTTPDGAGAWQQAFPLPTVLPAAVGLDLEAQGVAGDDGRTSLRITITGDTTPAPTPAGNG